MLSSSILGLQVSLSSKWARLGLATFQHYDIAESRLPSILALQRNNAIAMFPLLDFPEDIVHEVFGYVGLAELPLLMRTCKGLRDFITEYQKSLYKKVYFNHFVSC